MDYQNKELAVFQTPDKAVILKADMTPHKFEQVQIRSLNYLVEINQLYTDIWQLYSKNKN